jgi:ribonuclease HII
MEGIMLEIEQELWDKGYKSIACIDEVGRGCLAGSVMACAIIMPRGLLIEGVKDSKKLTPKKREYLFEIIKGKSSAVGIGEIGCRTVDEVNVKNAAKLAMMQAIENLKDNRGNKVIPDCLLIDAEKLNSNIPQLNIIKGDEKCHGIAAASIIAKVTRDRKMKELDKIYPEYNFAKNKGYGTKEHMQALIKYGPTEIHRKTFIKKILNTQEQLSF